MWFRQQKALLSVEFFRLFELPSFVQISSWFHTIIRIKKGRMVCYYQLAVSVALCITMMFASACALFQHPKAVLPTFHDESGHDLDLLAISSRLFLCCNEEEKMNKYVALFNGLDDNNSHFMGRSSQLRADVTLMPHPISRPDGSNATVLLSTWGGFDSSALLLLNVSLSMLSFQLSGKQQNHFVQDGGHNDTTTSVDSLINECLTLYDLSMQYTHSSASFGNNIDGTQAESHIVSTEKEKGTYCNSSQVYSIRTKDIHRGDFQEVLLVEDTKNGGVRIFHSSFKRLTRASLPEDLRRNTMLFGNLNETDKCQIFLATP
jgi:hypothetical protein